MPLDITSSVIKTIWENSPDTPITAAALSKISVVSGSYLNVSDGVFAPYPDTHEEYSIIYPDPDTTVNGACRRLILKRGSIFQIINEARDTNGTKIIPINEQYKLFDTGLDDIYIDLNYLDSNPQNPNINDNLWSTTLMPLREWFVYICDKDDGTVYTKSNGQEYGGGAQILVSMNSDCPVGDVPGRTVTTNPRYGLSPLYTKYDTRLIGGFKTTASGLIDVSSVWDVSGKYNTIKAKKFRVLDEHTSDSSGLHTFRKLDLRDISTSTAENNVFASGVTINGQLNLTGPFIQNGLKTLIGDMTQTGNLTLHGGIIQDTGNVALSTTTLTTSGSFTHSGHLMINNADSSNALEVANTSVNVFKGMNINGSVSIASSLGVSGDFQQTGNASLGGPGKNIVLIGTLSSTGAMTFNGALTQTGNVSVSGNMLVNGSTSTLNTSLIVNGESSLNGNLTSTGNIILGNTSGTVEINGSTSVNGSLSVTGSVSIPGNVSMGGSNKTITSVGTYTHTGKYKVVGTSDVGVSSSIIEYKSDIDSTIFNKFVYINSGIEISGSTQFDNNVSMQSDLTLSSSATLYASKATIAEISGNISSATKLKSSLTLNFTSGATGSVTFDGSEGTLSIPLTVDATKHDHDASYYTKTQLLSYGESQVEWGNVVNKPTIYPTAIATSTILGGVKIGANINVDGDGTISVSFPSGYALPTATSTTLGGVKIGSNITVAGDGTISVADPYVLPKANGTTLGGVKIGSNITVDGNGIISVAAPYSLPTASSTVIGGVKIGSNITIDGTGAISVASPYSLPYATSTTLGGVKIGSNINVDGNGVISVTFPASYTLPVSTSTVLGGVKIGSNITVAGDGTISVASPYSHPASHPASMITTDSSREFVSDTQISNWNSAYTASLTIGNYLPLSGGNITGSLTIGGSSIITASSIGAQHVSIADTANAVTWANVSNKPSLVLNDSSSYNISVTGSAGSVNWANVAGKPTNIVLNDSSTYDISISGSADSVSWVNVSGKPTDLVHADGSSYDLSITGDSATLQTHPASDFALTGHTHSGVSPVVIGNNTVAVGPIGQILVDTSSSPTKIYISDGTAWRELNLV